MSVCVRLVAGVFDCRQSLGLLIGSCLTDKGLKASSSQFLWALLSCCPTTNYQHLCDCGQTMFDNKTMLKYLLLVVFGEKGEGSLILWLHQGFP